MGPGSAETDVSDWSGTWTLFAMCGGEHAFHSIRVLGERVECKEEGRSCTRTWNLITLLTEPQERGIHTRFGCAPVG